jgi:hypothetical protein
MERPLAWRAHFDNHFFEQTAQARLSLALPQDVVGIGKDNKATGNSFGSFKEC